MSSKLGFLIVLGSVVLAGCGLKLGEHPSDGSIDVGSGQTQCLTGATKTLEDYFHGGTSDEQVSGVFTCTSNALKLFKDRVRGVAIPGSYTPQELRKFLEHYFLRDFTISDALMLEAMELKRTLLGGSIDELTGDELDRLQSILSTLNVVGIKVRPYLPLTPSNAGKLSKEELDKATSALRDAAVSLAQIFEAQATPYEFSHLDTLLEEIEKILDDDDYVRSTAQIRQYLPLFRRLKAILVSQNDQQMAGSDWRVMLTRVVDIYSLLLRTNQTLDTQPAIISGDGRLQIMGVAEDAYKFITDVINQNPYNTVSYCSLYTTIDRASEIFGHKQDLETLKRTNFAGYPIDLVHYLTDHEPKNDDDYLWYFNAMGTRFYRGTVKQTLQAVIQKALRPERDTDQVVRLHNGSKFPDFWNACENINGDPVYNRYGLRPENLSTLWETVKLISEGQNYLEKTFEWAAKNDENPTNPLDHEYLPIALTSGSLSDLFGVPQGSLLPETQEAADMLKLVIENHLPMFHPNDPQIQFGDWIPIGHGQTAPWRQSFVGLSALNAVRELVKLVWHAYIPDPKRIEKDPKLALDPLSNQPPTNDGSTGGISQEELREFYFDVKELGNAVKLFDPTSDKASDKRFLEANLFTYGANGDHYMSVNEGQDLVSFLYSSKMLSGRTYDAIHRECAKWTDHCPNSKPGCHIGPIDIYGNEKVSTACFNHFAFDVQSGLFQQLWDHMPNLEKYYEKLPSVPSQGPDDDVVYRETFRCLIETVAKGDGEDPNWIDSGDVDEMSALYHYLEAIFVRFGFHKDYVDQTDSMVAFPVLEQTLRDQAQKRGITFLSSQDDFQAVLEYILANGEIPSTDDWGSIISFGIRRYIYSADFRADRAQILRVMALIINTNVSACFTSAVTR